MEWLARVAVAATVAALLSSWSALAQSPPTTPGPVAAETAASSWPHTLTKDGASITVYQPQAISWPERQTLTARAAVAIKPASAATPILGTIELSLATVTDAAAGVVRLSDPKLLQTHFPALDTQRAAAVDEKIRAALPSMQTREVPLDAVLLSLKQLPGGEIAVSNDPPVIFYANRPASLVVFDGDPVMVPVGKAGLSFAVNTNWDVFALQGARYLLDNGLWLSASAASGPYKPVVRLTAAFSALPDDPSFAEASGGSGRLQGNGAGASAQGAARRGSYQQLEQDRLGRQAGEGRGAAGSAGSRYFRR